MPESNLSLVSGPIPADKDLYAHHLYGINVFELFLVEDPKQ